MYYIISLGVAYEPRLIIAVARKTFIYRLLLNSVLSASRRFTTQNSKINDIGLFDHDASLMHSARQSVVQSAGYDGNLTLRLQRGRGCKIERISCSWALSAFKNSLSSLA